jgi:hypothetical protein
MNCRYLSQGRTILQPYHLIDELNIAIEENKETFLEEGPFAKLIRKSQVHILPLQQATVLALSLSSLSWDPSSSSSSSSTTTSFSFPSSSSPAASSELCKIAAIYIGTILGSWQFGNRIFNQKCAVFVMWGIHGGGNFFCLLQEAIVLPPWVGFATRPRPGIWEYLRVNVEELVVEELSVSEYLGFKEHLSKGSE